VVVGPPGEEIYPDKYGRVKVQFHWDREGKRDGNTSCWIRVAQIWAGKRWGAFFWPRAGQEVVVVFEEGDPDQPQIIGSVYNAENMPPFAMPANPLVNGIKSCSEHGASHRNFNALLFYDKPGDEHTQIHSEKHQAFTNETGKHNFIGQAHTKVVGGIPRGGSGSGGGAPQPPPDPTATTPGSYNLKDRAPAGSFGRDLDLTYGEAFEGMLGLQFAVCVGGKTEFCWNPISQWVGEASKLSTSPAMGPLVGLMTLLGKTEFSFCGDSSFLYGPKLDIQRGPNVVWQDDLMQEPAAYALATLVTLAPLLMTLAYEAKSETDWSLQERNGWWFALNAVWNVLQIGLASFESLNAVGAICKSVLAEHQALIEQFTPLLVGYNRALGFPNALTILKKIQNTTPTLVLLPSLLEKDRTPSATWKAWGYPDIQMINGIFMRRAHDIELVSSWKETEPAGFGICIDAQGGGPSKKDGHLILNATGSVTLTAGTNGLAISNEGKRIVVEPDQGGEILLQIPGPATMPLASIFLSAKGITLQVGSQTKIELTPAGITFQGLKLDNDQEVIQKMQAIVLNKDAKGALTIKGKMTKIGP